jgi:hypothetical protein
MRMMSEEGYNKLLLVVLLCLISVPLAIWKMIDIIIWLFR